MALNVLPSIDQLRGIGLATKLYLNDSEGIYVVPDLCYIICRKKHEGYSDNEIHRLLYTRIVPPSSPIRNDFVEQCIRQLQREVEEYEFDENSIVGRHLHDPEEVILETDGCVKCSRVPQRRYRCGHGICHYCYLEFLNEHRWTALMDDPQLFPHLIQAPQVVVECLVCPQQGGARPI